MEIHPGLLVKAVTTPSAAVALSTTDLWVSAAIVFAKKTAGDNTGNVFIGDSTLDQADTEGPELAPGESIPLPIRDGQRMNLKDVYIDADNTADGVVVFYSK